MPFRRSALLMTAALLWIGTAHAQQATPTSGASTPAAPVTPAAGKAPAKTATNPDTASASDDTTVVTITADKPIIQHKIDRDVYDVKQDPQATTGSAADVLNNVPAVTVDNDGTVSLRGNSGVQVYVNGKKSAQMQGDNRAFSLQSLAADDIDSIEVIPNPGAAYGSDSAGGIINIVMKRGRALRPQTSVNASVGDQGRASVGFRTGKTIGKLKLNGSLNLNHGGGGNGRGGGGQASGGQAPKVKSLSDRYRLDPATGDVTREDLTNTVSKSSNNNISANMTAEYDFTDRDDLTADLSYSRRDSRSVGASETLSYDRDHTLISDIARLSNSVAPNENLDFRLTYDHRGQVGSTEDFKMQLWHSSSLNDGVTVTRSVRNQPAADDIYTTYASKTKKVVDGFSGDWSHPLGNYDETQRQIQLGWDIEHTVSDSYNYRSLSLAEPVSSPASPSPSGVRQFDDDEVLSAAYATYQQQFGKLGFQAGLRVEDLHQKLLSANPLLPATAVTATRDMMNYSPSVFFTYKATDKDNLKLAYSRKIQRPTGSQLDPLVVISADGLTARSGNSNLKPSQTDKYDLAYTHDGKTTNLNLQAFYNATTGSIETVSSFLPGQPDVLLTSYQNSGSSHNQGLTASLSSRLFDRKLNINLNGTYTYTDTRYTDVFTHQPVESKGPFSNLSLNTNYRPDRVNTYSFRVLYRGETNTVERRVTPQTTLGLSWQHQIVPSKLILTFNASNIIVGPASKTYSFNSVQRSYTERYDQAATFMVNLRYTFGKVINRQRGDGPRGPRPQGDDGDRGGGRWRQ
ncbi:hypothetical protein AEAC466_05990 [Asticcacaulis sp. AC466]|uniref:TonB-dependent receptor n=1 Tax=Asticcacaulis sp. AC466 TaxID=1282362 RepID=UPI0003C3DA93|nr:TonB-dependent receptor [Asticcacaulis sp. AC466]ESQ85261.1 hypothetical protein AEAC466_05990 [Asticcacaulis sp. AC466]